MNRKDVEGLLAAISNSDARDLSPCLRTPLALLAGLVSLECETRSPLISEFLALGLDAAQETADFVLAADFRDVLEHSEQKQRQTRPPAARVA